ncbi:hypothetical protein [Novosphingobium sp. KN65.2]|uniref:hypothetical protein n=1 Tax=Novosphingobium sp. KN65.2 TaxID=1478134 RepID=UPI0005E0A9B5|nr:hypothetical protein [Novosphingobium sp. KN65.2]CDO34022.1 hypothetical protein SPHV1_100056 [Novosphingobium sp. KN65.2]
MRCDQCKHWDEPREWDFDYAGMRRCLAIKQAWDVENAAFPHEGKDKYDFEDWSEVQRIEAEALKAAKAVAQDGSSYAASIRTTGDFGCVLFEQKP